MKKYIITIGFCMTQLIFACGGGDGSSTANSSMSSESVDIKFDDVGEEGLTVVLAESSGSCIEAGVPLNNKALYCHVDNSDRSFYSDRSLELKGDHTQSSRVSRKSNSI